MREQYQTIARVITRWIDTGKYCENAYLPNRQELARQFKVARATVDRSVRLLVQRGILVSRQGMGTRVALGRITRSVAVVGLPAHDAVAEPPADTAITYFTPGQLQSRNARKKLENFDGILWYLPGNEVVPWMSELSRDIPSLVVNRRMRDYNYVTTDHAGAIHAITGERLGRLPHAIPCLLQCDHAYADLVTRERKQGFVAACRESARFYEIIGMPGAFTDKLRMLEDRLRQYADRPLIVVSDSRSHTGAFVRWAREHKRAWLKDLFYSDFDNTMAEEMLGLRVTTFLQDWSGLLRIGLRKLLDLVEMREERVQVLLSPRMLDGDT